MKHLSLPNESLRNVLLLSAVFCTLCSLPVHAKSDVDEAPLLMLRFSKEHSDTEEHWANMLSILRQYPECCDEVWFSTGTTVPPLEVHAAHVEMMKRGKADLQRLGIGTSVQVQMTIGHGDSSHTPAGWEAKTWTGWTGSTGVEARYCNCPRQPEFLNYIRAMARLYAEVHPRTVWIDDDLRYDNHYPATRDSRLGCWCATCLKAFSDEEHRMWTRETLDQAMASDPQLAARWKAFSIESLRRIAEIIAQETKAVSPETRMGYQKTFWDEDSTVVRVILQTLARVSGQRVDYRPGGSAYYDRKHPAEQIVKSMDAARFMRVMGCPDYVATWCPEVESWPRHYGSRTAQSVLLEAFTGLAYGMNAVSMYVTDRWEETPELQARSMIGPVADGADVLRRYAHANRATEAVGFRCDGDDNHPLYEFGTLGIPVLPGMGRSLGTLTRDELSPVNIYGEPSSAVQRVRQQMDERAPSPVLCLSPYVGLLIPRVLADGTLRTVGLLNGRIDTQGPIRLCLRSLPSDVQKVTWRELRRKPVKLRVERDEDGVAYVSVPSIGAWNAGFLEIGTVSRK